MNVGNVGNATNAQPSEFAKAKESVSSAVSFFSDYFNNLGSLTNTKTQVETPKKDSAPVKGSPQTQQNQTRPVKNQVAQKSDVNPNEDNKVVEKNNSESSAESASAEKVNAKDETKKLPKEVETAEKDFVKKIAEALGVSEEKVAEVMQILGLTVLDLTDKQNVDKLLLAVFEMERPSDLLNLTGIVGMFNDIKEISEEFSAFVKAVNTDNELPVSEFADDLLNAQALEVEKADTEDKAVKTLAPVLEETSQVVTSTRNRTESESGVAPVVAQPVTTEATTEDEAVKELFAKAQNVETQQPIRVENATSSNSGGQQADSSLMGNEQGINLMLPEEGVISAVQSFDMSSVDEIAKSEAAPVRQSIDVNDIMNQMLDKMKVDVRANVTEVRMTLRPESLGDISLKLATENGIVTAQFLAENERVKEVIESNFNQLKDALEEQGIAVSSLSVEVGSEKGQRMFEEFERGRSQSAGRVSRIMNGMSEEAVIEEEQAEAQHVDGNMVNYFA